MRVIIWNGIALERVKSGGYRSINFGDMTRTTFGRSLNIVRFAESYFKVSTMIKYEPIGFKSYSIEMGTYQRVFARANYFSVNCPIWYPNDEVESSFVCLPGYVVEPEYWKVNSQGVSADC